MAAYDAAVIQKHVDGLYSRANTIVGQWTFQSALVGVLGGLVMSPVFLQHGAFSLSGAFGPMAIGAIALGVVGLRIGQDRAFKLRLAAQTMLCQMQIEANTRKAP